MSIESDFFARKRPDYNRIESCGFQKIMDDRRGTDGNKDSARYKYSEVFMDGQFRADIMIDRDGRVSGNVIDLETEEEYLPLRVVDQVGEFVGTVRESYAQLLGRLSNACFIPVNYIYDQSNRIEAKIEQEFDVISEFPWEKYPGNGTYKCCSNSKWFAVILTVDFGKLSPAKAPELITVPHDDDEVVEVVNVKADPARIPELTKRAGIYPAWHMNKTYWISVILDGTLSDEDIMDLIRQSHGIVAGGKSSHAIRSGAWMIPSNPKIYDVDAGFAAGGGEIEWHQHNDILPGDEVYISSSAPNSAILYRCEVVASNLPYKGMFQESKGYTRSMRIRLVEKYPKDRFPLSFIKAHGGSVVRSARTMPAELLNAIRTYDLDNK